MQWLDGVDRKSGCKVSFSLRDLRVAKGLTQRQLAAVLGVSKSLYHSIESGHRKPGIDVLFKLAAVYRTSMDFVYHAYYRQHYVWNYPDHELKYALKEAAEIDILYLRDRVSPEPPAELPVAYVFERAADGAEVGAAVY